MAVVTELLAPLRAHGGARRTVGLDEATLARFAAKDPQLVAAIEAAATEYAQVRAEFPELLELDEDAQTLEVQSGFVNFYAHDAANPYVALAARGPWLVTLKGAVLYDTGGYGMGIPYGDTTTRPSPTGLRGSAPACIALSRRSQSTACISTSGSV